MKKWICVLISKLTFNKVCLNWCKVESKTEVKQVVVKKPTKTKVAGPSVVEKKPTKKKPSKKGKTTITESMKKSFIKDRESGMSFKAIGEKHGIPTSTVTYHIKNNK